MRPSGFTLIELVAVVLILSIVAAAVVIRVQAPLAASNMRDLADRIGNYDALTRLQAAELDRKLLVEIDLDKGELRRLDPEKRDAMGEPLELAAGLRIGMAITADGKRSTGRIALPYSRRGMSRSYALKLEGPSGRSQWMLVTGLAGRTVELTDEKEVEEVMAIATPRPDAR